MDELRSTYVFVISDCRIIFTNALYSTPLRTNTEKCLNSCSTRELMSTSRTVITRKDIMQIEYWDYLTLSVQEYCCACVDSHIRQNARWFLGERMAQYV